MLEGEGGETERESERERERMRGREGGREGQKEVPPCIHKIIT